jgi:hypothetical protein
MKLIKVLPWVMWSLIFTLTSLPGLAADYPAPRERCMLPPHHI